MGYHSRITGQRFRGIVSTIPHELGHRCDLIELRFAHQERNRVRAPCNPRGLAAATQEDRAAPCFGVAAGEAVQRVSM